MSVIRNLYRSLGLIILSCSTTHVYASDPLAYYGFDKGAYSTEAQEGMEDIFAGNLFYSAVPVSTARMLLRVVTASQKDAVYDPDSPEGKFYTSGRLPSPPSRTSGTDPGFGLGESIFPRDGSQVFNVNCFLCHAGVVKGQVVAGLANNHINQSDPRKIRTRGDNFGPYAVWLLGARLENPEKEGLVVSSKRTELQAMIESLNLPPVDPMPWWLMKYKTKDYWYADAGTHDAASFSINFTTPHKEMNAHHAEHVKVVAKALAFARETQSPLFPGTLDAEKVKKGADLFHGRTPPAETNGFVSCKNCHGTYTKKASQTDLSKPGSWSVDYHFSHVLRDVKRTMPTTQRFESFSQSLTI